MNNLKKVEIDSFKLLWGMIIIGVILLVAILVWKDRIYQGLEAYGFKYGNDKFMPTSELELSPNKTNLSIKLKNAISEDGEHYLIAILSIYIAGHQGKKIIQEYGEKKCDQFKLKWTLYSGHKNYGPSVWSVSCCTAINTVSCNYNKKIRIYPISGSVVNYPLDKYTFAMPFLFDSKIDFDTVKIFNHTQNLIDSKSLNMKVVDSKLYEKLKEDFSGSHFLNYRPQFFLSFKMHRGRSLTIAYVTILSFLIFFLYLFIMKINTMKGLLASVTGFFFSVWSLRQILDPKDKIPMDLLDVTIIFFSVLILLTILTKLVFNLYKDE